jgi:hypothetical protein
MQELWLKRRLAWQIRIKNSDGLVEMWGGEHREACQVAQAINSVSARPPQGLKEEFRMAAASESDNNRWKKRYQQEIRLIGW